MNNNSDALLPDAAVVALALSEYYPERSYGASPLDEQSDALAAWVTFDEGVLSDVPLALAAYLEDQHDRESA